VTSSIPSKTAFRQKVFRPNAQPSRIAGLAGSSPLVHNLGVFAPLREISGASLRAGRRMPSRILRSDKEAGLAFCECVRLVGETSFGLTY
jgi:hypothetical protein